MSLPESEKELLLSASIDGVLSPEEQEVLDRWLREDPAAAKRRDELASLVSSVQDAYRSLRRGGAATKPLGRDFAESIVDRAISQAMAEKLPPAHPLVKIGKHNQVDLHPEVLPSGSWSRIAVIAALAASVLGGVFLATRGGLQDEMGGSLAQADPAVIEKPSDNMAEVSPLPSLDPAQPSPQPEMIASADVEKMPELPAAEPNASSAVDIASATTPATLQPAMSPANVEVPDPATVLGEDESVELSAVMVVSVELTEAGRQSLALLTALREADIRLGTNGVVSDQVVSDLQKSAVVQTAQDAQAAKLYFVEAPARQIDRFLMQVMADKNSFASIGLGIADNPPLLASIGRWRPGDAEKDASSNPIGQRLTSEAKPKSVARDLVTADGKPLSIDRGAAVIPMERNSGIAAFMMPPPTAGAKDFSAQLILLVH